MKAEGRFRVAWLRVRSLLQRQEMDRELSDELGDHVERKTAEYVGHGMDAAEARRAALLELGGVEQVKEACRDERRVGWLQDFAGDVRYGLRMLWKAPGFAAIAVLTLALGIGANTAIFSVVNGVLLRPLPYPQPERLVRVTNLYPLGGFVAMRWRLHTMSVATYWEGTELNLTGMGEPERLYGASVSAELFSVLEAGPELGRVFATGEDLPNRNNEVILSDALWREKFGARPEAVGSSVELGGVKREIVGVMPANFRFPSAKTLFWAPLDFDPGAVGAYWGGPFLPVIGRLRAGVSEEQAKAELRTFAPGVVKLFPWKMPDNWSHSTLLPLQEDLVASGRTELLLLLGAIGFVLLIACANVANLLLARGAARQREIAMRAALGAGRWRICRQLLTESLVLGALGGMLGMAAAIGGLPLLKAILPADTPRLAGVAIDWRVLAFTAAIAVLTGLLFGIVPALHASRADLTESLKMGRQPSTAGSHRLRNALATAEVALAAILVVAAGLTVKSLWELSRVNPGFRAESVFSARITPSAAACVSAERCRAFYGALLDRVRAIPGVDEAEMVSVLPLAGRVDGFAADLEGHPRAADGSAPMLFESVITPGYLHLMDIPLLRGRGFDASDTAATAAPVALVTASTARKYWPGQDPVGKHLKPVFVDTWMTVVGVVGDVTEASLASPLPEWAEGAIYVPYGNAARLAPRHGRGQPIEMTLVARTTRDGGNLASVLRQAVESLNATVPVSEVETVGTVVSKSLRAPRSTMYLFAVFALLALALGAVGVYGVISCTVAQRTPEFGIRVALGAQKRDVMGLVMWQGGRVALVGVAVGIAGALAVTRLMSSLLFGVSASDPFTYGAVAVLLTLVALGASWAPARRALRVDPVVALRQE